MCRELYAIAYYPHFRRAGGSLGALNHAIVVDQFTRLRDGDSWWYENPGVLDVPTLNAVKKSTWVGPGWVGSSLNLPLLAHHDQPLSPL